MIFTAPAILTSIAYTKDNGLRLGFVTQELTNEAKVSASQFYGSFGHLLFKENQFTEKEIPDTQATDETKSPSKKLRAVLFILWKQRGEQGEFENYYRCMMQQFIDDIKKILD